MTNFGPGELRPGMTTLEVAFTQLGVAEVGGNNRGPRVEEYLASVSRHPGDPWCYAFAYWCAHKAGLWVPRTGSTHRAAELGKAIVVPYGAAGDVALHLKLDGTGHAGIVSVRRAATYETVEGNTDDGGSREGDEVALKERPGDYWHVFLRPCALGEDLT